MPESPQFLQAFNLIPGKKFSRYTLEQAYSTHEVVRKYHEYRYDITLLFRNSENITIDQGYLLFFEALIKEISQIHIIYGIRNPYRCYIDHPKDNSITYDSQGNITVKLIGHGTR